MPQICRAVWVIGLTYNSVNFERWVLQFALMALKWIAQKFLI